MTPIDRTAAAAKPTAQLRVAAQPAPVKDVPEVAPAAVDQAKQAVKAGGRALTSPDMRE